MHDLNLEHYKTFAGDLWFPYMVFRVSGIVVDGTAASDTVCRSPVDGTTLSVYVLDEVYSDSGLLIRFGESVTEGGYLVAQADAVSDIHKQLCRAELLPGWSPPSLSGKLAVNDGLTDRIDSRNPSVELHEPVRLKPIMVNPQTGIEIAAPPRIEKGAQVELTNPQANTFTELLETYLADPTSLCGNTPDTILVGSNGHQQTQTLTKNI